MNTTIDRLRVLLVKDYRLDPATLLPDAPLEALGIDSLGLVELLWNVEDEFRIKLPQEPVPLATLGDVVLYIDQKVAEQAAAAGAATAGAEAGLRAS